MDGIGRSKASSPSHRAVALVQRFLRRRLKPIRRLRLLRISLWIVEGCEATSGAPLSIFHAGRDPIDPYFARLIFGDTYHVREAGGTWIWNLSRAIRRRGRGCALAFVEIRKSDPEPLRMLEGFHIPLWLVGECDLPCPQSILKATSVRSDLELIRRNELRSEITRDERHFDDFYENMYLPHVKRSHGEGAQIRSYGEVKKSFENGELLLIKQQEQVIAGLLIEYRDGVPQLQNLGARDGNRDYLRCGGVAALYYFALSALADQGHEKVGFGGSRAFLDDGVLRYKRKWGHRIVGVRGRSLVLRILKYSPGATAFLTAHPFIHQKDGALVAAVFDPSGHPASAKDLRRIERRYAHSGLAGFEFHSARSDRHPPAPPPPS